MPLSPERMAELDQYYAGQQAGGQDYLTQLSPDKSAGLTPQRVAELDAYYAKNPSNSIAKPADVAIKPQSFLGEMGANFGQGIQAAKDVLSGDYEDIGRTRPTPKTGALADKLFPKGSDGSFMGAVRNVGNTNTSDWSGALLEKFGETPEGKILSAIGGVHPIYNAVGTTVSREINPAITDATGIAPENLQLLELGAGTLGLKKAGQIQDPLWKATKSIAGNVGEGVGNRAKGAFGTMSAEDIAAQSDKNWAGSSASFKGSREAGAVLTPEAGNAVLQQATDAINSAGILNPKRHTATIAALEDLQKDVESGNLSLEKLDQHRQAFADAVKDNTTKMEGMNSDAYRALQAKNAIVDSISNFGKDHFSAGTPEAADSLLTGINQWAQAARFDRVADLIKKSEGDSTAIKRNFTNFVNKESNLKGFNADEIAALKDAASRGVLEKVERGIGTFGFDFGKVKNVALPAITSGTSAVVPGGAPLAVAGTVLRQTGKYAARGKAQTALDTIMNRPTAPAARPIPTAEVTPVKPTLALPAPERAMIVDETGNSRLQTSQERDIAITERNRLQEIGLTPDVMNTQAKQNASRLMLKYGQSDLGKFVAQNSNKALTDKLFDIPNTEYSQAQVNQMLRNGAWEKITASQKAQISAEVAKAWNEHQTPLAEMIMDAEAKAKELALAKGESYKRTGFGEALNNAISAPKKRSMGVK